MRLQLQHMFKYFLPYNPLSSGIIKEVYQKCAKKLLTVKQLTACCAIIILSVASGVAISCLCRCVGGKARFHVICGAV